MSDIKIFVSCHREAKIVKDPAICPVQVGCALTDKRLDGMAYYDNGEEDNISALNKKYCELTAQYYVFKHVSADYYGFFHYRRYLSFSEKYSRRAQYKADCIDGGFKEKFGLNFKSVANTVENYDVIMPKTACFVVSNRRQYAMSKAGFVKDLDFCIDVIKRDYPHMYPSAKRYMRSSKAYICNMFIMKRELFLNYSEWLFDILKKFDQAVDCSEYTPSQYRVDGYLSERLLGIYVTWLKDAGEYKIKELPRVFVKNN